jgi:SSS family solute:Na+ symporter
LLPKNPVTKQGAFAGIVVGAGAVVYFTLSNQTLATLFPSMPEFFRDLNIGTVAVVLNICALAVVSLVTGLRTQAVAAE